MEATEGCLRGTPRLEPEWGGLRVALGLKLQSAQGACGALSLPQGWSSRHGTGLSQSGVKA